MNEIILSDGISYGAITKTMVEQCCSDLIEKTEKLGYTKDACYEIAAINLWLCTRSFAEKDEILNLLGLK